jgi:hypothetical protein
MSGKTKAIGEPRLLNAQRAASYLGVPYTSLRDWALRGHVPIVRPPGCRRLWFDKRDLDRLIDLWKHREPAPYRPPATTFRSGNPLNES